MSVKFLLSIFGGIFLIFPILIFLDIVMDFFFRVFFIAFCHIQMSLIVCTMNILIAYKIFGQTL